MSPINKRKVEDVTDKDWVQPQFQSYCSRLGQQSTLQKGPRFKSNFKHEKA